VKDAGYDGVEVYPLQVPHEKYEMLEQLRLHDLEFSLLHTEMKEGKDVKKYYAALERNLYELATYQTSDMKPQFITSQTGREYYTMEQMAECFSICDRMSTETGIIHETHRNKWSYAAHVVKAYLQKFPSVQLALDFSHWVCVSESYLEDQQDTIDAAIQRSVHLHARVGHIEGAQVTDPRAPENAEALQHHLGWWDKWMTYLVKTNAEKCTITPEFGSYPYMSFKPFTKEPLADQWEINCWMKGLLKNRYTQTLNPELEKLESII